MKLTRAQARVGPGVDTPLDVTCKSCEQRLINKEHIATHTNLILLFKPALYSSTFVIECFKSSIKLF